MIRVATIAALPVALLAASAGAQVQPILNPSFEEVSDGVMPNGANTDLYDWWGMPDHWTWRSQGHCNGHGIRFPNSGWVTDGDWVLYMFAMVGYQHEAGDFVEWYQIVDLTHVDAIYVDALLSTHAHTASYVAIDGQDRWSSGGPGEYHGILVNVASDTGLHELALGVRAVEDFHGGGLADGQTHWDNLQVSGSVAVEGRTWSDVRALFR
jgi:hypothetical protein